jgi:uncharacterized protein (DUF58 family)
MNAFNRIVMLIIAVLLVAIPVLVLLIAFGVVPADVVNQYTGYRGAVGALGDLSAVGTGARTIIALAGALLALIALLLLLREFTFGRRVARNTTIDDTPGNEIRITASAVKALAEGAAREAGAQSPSATLTSDERSYQVSCQIQAPPSGNYTEVASRTRENIRRVLEDQGVPLEDVEVTVKGSAS